MKLGEVLRKERERKGLSTQEVATRLGVGLSDLEAIEAGEHPAFEDAAGWVLQFNQLIEGQVSQFYYPCGIPFQELDDYPILARGF
ncbi:MAG: helix-turn-helix domain-containing protein [Acidobacteriota bacterium]